MHKFYLRIHLRDSLGLEQAEEKLVTEDRNYAIVIAKILQRSHSVQTAYVVEQDEDGRWVRNW